MIFPSDITLAMLNATSQGNMAGFLGIEYTNIGPDYLEAKMPVGHRTQQPQGLLNGGASVVLAETLGSLAANLVVDREKYYCVGLDINANHVRSVTEGYVYAIAKPLHIGRSTHVWQIHITNEKAQLICISRLTVAVLDRRDI
jgi:1,4-dihydroxy-2-naphthoyl-CoA hydrolase